MKIGDIITTYYKGFFRIEKMEERESTPSPLYYFYQVCDSNGKPVKGNVLKSCDALFCAPAEDFIKKEEERLNKLKEWLK